MFISIFEAAPDVQTVPSSFNIAVNVVPLKTCGIAIAPSDITLIIDSAL